MATKKTEVLDIVSEAASADNSIIGCLEGILCTLNRIGDMIGSIEDTLFDGRQELCLPERTQSIKGEALTIADYVGNYESRIHDILICLRGYGVD